MKTCSKCRTEKAEDEFYKNTRGGSRPQCKLCMNDYSNKYAADNRGELSEKNKIYRKEHKEEIKKIQHKCYLHTKDTRTPEQKQQRLESSQKYRAAHPEKERERNRLWRKNNPEKAKESERKTKAKRADKDKEWRIRYHAENKEQIAERAYISYHENPEKYRERGRLWFEKNKEGAIAAHKIWKQENREHVRVYHREYTNKRLKEDPEFKLIWYMRIVVRHAIKTRSKGGRIKSLIGCSVEQLRSHIESQFLPGMTWDNWAKDGWHIDHSVPISAFDMTDPEQQKLCFNYTNLRPLWWLDNLKKGAKLERPFQFPLSLAM